VCESMYKENLEPEELFEVISQCLLSGSGRDCLSGWGGTVYLITKDKVEVKSLKGRMD
jgi:20S proteasome subunit beta 3